MPSEFNHIDDFFRRKDEESDPETDSLGKHWQQMQQMMQSPAPADVGRKASRISWKKGRLYVQAAILFLTASILSLLLYWFINSAESLQQNPPPSPVKAAAVKDPFTKNHQAIIAFPSDPTNISQSGLKSITSNSIRNLDRVQQSPVEKQITADYIPIEPKKGILETPVTTNAEAFEVFFQQLQKQAQLFVIRNHKDTTLYCSGGTTVFIPAGSLEAFSDADVQVFIKEYYEIADIIGNKLSTHSNLLPLVTGGMLHIEAMQGNIPVTLKKGRSLKVFMPTKKNDPEMQLFLGKETALSPMVENSDIAVSGDRTINWLPAGQYQYYFNDRHKLIKVLDLANDPRNIFIRKNKKIGKFILSYDSKLSVKDAKRELQHRYGNQYDEIRVRHGWLPMHITWDKQNLPFTSTQQNGDGIIGDSVNMTLKEARLFNLISVSDSLQWEADWRKNWEVSAKSNPVIKQQLQLKDQYSFEISGMGYINCDKFLASKGKTINLTAKTGETFESTYFRSFLVFRNINSILPGVWSAGRIVFYNLPEDQRATMVCIGIKEGKAWYAIREVSANGREINDLKFTETTPDEFRHVLQQFGNVKG
jgi:hypothetical protein